MNKKTKIWLGVGVVAVAAYYFWNKSQKDSSKTMSANGRKKGGTPCQYIEDGYLYSGRIISGTNTCQGSGITSKGEAL
jgi:hypothetical protein